MPVTLCLSVFIVLLTILYSGTTSADLMLSGYSCTAIINASIKFLCQLPQVLSILQPMEDLALSWYFPYFLFPVFIDVSNISQQLTLCHLANVFLNALDFVQAPSLSESLPQTAGSSMLLGAHEPLLAFLSSRCGSYLDQVLSNFSYFWVAVEYQQL
ncbi:unnamed protein product [Dracunculus medinensis]|uniref:Secreted protein n=1 Tax=Dracunculus medinensis TaxID=318479 RepID=A0A0N4U973_DRAME|nr:unnamed protein product [Dracunculus medinensis]